MKQLIYIASPYTKGDVAVNTRFQCQIFNEMLDDGIVIPYAPLMSHFQHTIFPRHYQDWINYDLDIINKMDACLRLNATYEPMKYCQKESSGADGEAKRFNELNKPVFYNKEDLYKWVSSI